MKKLLFSLIFIISFIPACCSVGVSELQEVRDQYKIIHDEYIEYVDKDTREGFGDADRRASKALADEILKTLDVYIDTLEGESE